MRLLFLALMAWTFVSVANGVENTSDFDRNKTFLTTYCFSCHGNEKSEGGHNFEAFNDSDWNNHDLLDELLWVVVENEMPPVEAKKKPSAEEIAIYEELLSKQHQATKSKLPGVLTRLNRAEYQNTINDALFTKLEVKSHLPVDNTRHGFDNEGDKLVMSPFAVDSYFQVASEIAEKVVGSMPGTSTTIHNYGNGHLRRLGSMGFAYYEATNDGITSEGFIYKDYSRGVGFKYGVTLPGHYDVKVDGHFTHFFPTLERDIAALIKRDLTFKVDVGKENEWLTITTNVDPKISREPLSTQDFLLSDTARVYLEPGQNLVLYSHNYFYPLPRDLSRLTRIPPLPRDETLANLPKTALHFISAEVTGPYYASWPPKNDFYKTYYYEDLKGNDPHEQYQQFIKKLAIKLFRRPVSDEELKQYFDVAKKRYETDEDVFNAVQSALTMLLCSPKFLYKYEGDSVTLDDYAIASRLSYFLWNSLPDDRLIKLASEGKLKDSEVRSAEALRMMQDPKGQRFAPDFTDQWLELDKIDVVTPQDDLVRYSLRNFESIKPFLREETIEFFKVILDENLSLLNFIDSDFVVVNRNTAGLYEVTVPEEQELPKDASLIEQDEKKRREEAFRKVMLDEGSVRGGLLTQAGILMMNTNGEFTNPFYRGAWVAESIYGYELTIPADLEIGTLTAPTETFSIKDSINEHRNNPQCASCHSRMDPFGLALESFDVFGRYRESYEKFVVTIIPEEKKDGEVVRRERITREFEKTTKVESDAVHRDGRAIDGIEGLKKIILEDQDKFARNVLTKLSEYAMGRKMNYADSEMIHRLLEVSKKNDYKLRDLMISIIADEAFTKR